jgi:membrane fusion protein (multidrug efflux system)
LKLIIFRWIKKNIIASLILIVLLLWAIEKIWPLIASHLFAHTPTSYVETILLKPQASTQTSQAVGTIKAMHNITIESEVTGVIETLNVSNNQKVNQGDVLLSIKHDDITANLQKNQAILAQKKLYYQRLERLSKSVSEESLSVALSEYQQAEATAAVDQAALNKYIVKAPFAGVLGIWQVDIGQLAKPGDQLITLSQLSPAFIDFMLPAKALNSIQLGDAIQFTTPNYPDRIWHGDIIAIDPQLDSATRNIILRAKINNEDNKLVPNLYGKILVIKTLSPQILIPQEAISMILKERLFMSFVIKRLSRNLLN